MTILIAIQNQDIIKNILPKVSFTESTKNTCTFKVSEKKFNTLYNEVKLLGYNPYALLAW